MDKVEASRSSRFEKGRFSSLPPREKFRYFVSLFGAAGLLALAAAGCADKGSSGNKNGSPQSGNTPVQSEKNGSTMDAPNKSDNKPADSISEDTTPAEDTSDHNSKSEEETKASVMVDVELYTEDRSGEMYTSRMTFEEMEGLCEDQRQEMIEEAEEAGLEMIGGPIVTLPYVTVGSVQESEYMCGQP
jgi:hypothetical protein